MNILIYVRSLDNGGAERVASLWAKGFNKQGHNVSIVLDTLFTPIKYNVPQQITVIRQFQPSAKILARLIDFVKLNKTTSRFFERIWNNLPRFFRSKRLANVIQARNPDTIVIVMPEFYQRVKRALNKIKRHTPIIVTDHNPFERPDYAPLSPQGEKEKFIDSRDYDFLTVLTEADKLVLEKKMDANFMKKVSVLPNPLTYEPLKSIPPKEKIILAAGRLDDSLYKGFDLLLMAWAKIHKSYPDWKLKIAGGGNKQPLLKACQKLGITDRVDFLGFIDIQKQFEKAEIFVLSSRYEGFGMVLTEAMSQGCASIACDYKGRQREIIENDAQGLICPPDDDNAIAGAICKVITDEQYRHDLQKNAIERAKYYELPNIMQRWNEIFEKLGLVKK